MYKRKLRPAITSLTWKLMNGQLPLRSHFSPTQACPLCGGGKHQPPHGHAISLNSPIAKLLQATSEMQHRPQQPFGVLGNHHQHGHQQIIWGL